MRLPRNLAGAELIRKLEGLGYRRTRQTGSHVRLTISEPSEHNLTVPLHDPLRIGTLSAILTHVAEHRGLARDELYAQLFG